jgi:hypothetical protein
MKGHLIIVLLCGSLWAVESAKMLFLAPMPARSHFALVFRLAKELADRGHEITFINPYPQKTPIKNYTDVSVEELVGYIGEYLKALLNRDKVGMYENLDFIYTMGYEIADRTFKNKNVQKLLNSGEKFDVVIMEHFLNEALIGLGHHFKAPVILMSTVATNCFSNYIMANPAPSSYVPNLRSTLTKNMNFWQRLQSFGFNFIFDVSTQMMHLPRQRTVFKRYIDTDLEFDDVLYNVSLILANSHVSINDAVPLVPYKST